MISANPLDGAALGTRITEYVVAKDLVAAVSFYKKSHPGMDAPCFERNR
jgi:hypothetical protein